jgi:hypothetical protein
MGGLLPKQRDRFGKREETSRDRTHILSRDHFFVRMHRRKLPTVDQQEAAELPFPKHEQRREFIRFHS